MSHPQLFDSSQPSLEQCLGLISGAIGVLLDLVSRVNSKFIGNAYSHHYWVWMLLYAGGAAVIWLVRERRENEKISLAKAIGYSFPKQHWWTPAAGLDYAWFVLWASYIGIIGEIPAKWGLSYRPPGSGGFAAGVFSALYAMALIDLGYTWNHYLFHRVRWLWEFHKVHHAPTHLNFFTANRVHPLETLGQVLASNITILLGATLITRLGVVPSIEGTLFGIGISTLLFNTVHLNIFRHTHVWISFGPLSYMFSSPAMHQVHHSVDPRHHNKNFAQVFSIFDWILGTLYVPKRKESLVFGIPRSQWGNKRYDTFLGNLFHPFVPNSWLSPRPDGEKRVSSASRIRRAG